MNNFDNHITCLMYVNQWLPLQSENYQRCGVTYKAILDVNIVLPSKTACKVGQTKRYLLVLLLSHYIILETHFTCGFSAPSTVPRGSNGRGGLALTGYTELRLIAALQRNSNSILSLAAYFPNVIYLVTGPLCSLRQLREDGENPFYFHFVCVGITVILWHFQSLFQRIKFVSASVAPQAMYICIRQLKASRMQFTFIFHFRK